MHPSASKKPRPRSRSTVPVRPAPPRRLEEVVDEEAGIDTEVNEHAMELLAALTMRIALPEVTTLPPVPVVTAPASPAAMVAAPVTQPMANVESTEPNGEVDISPTDPLVPVHAKPKETKTPKPRPRTPSSPWSKVPANALFSALLFESAPEEERAKPRASFHTVRPRVRPLESDFDFDVAFDETGESLVDTEVMEQK